MGRFMYPIMAVFLIYFAYFPPGLARICEAYCTLLANWELFCFAINEEQLTRTHHMQTYVRTKKIGCSAERLRFFAVQYVYKTSLVSPLPRLFCNTQLLFIINFRRINDRLFTICVYMLLFVCKYFHIGSPFQSLLKMHTIAISQLGNMLNCSQQNNLCI